MRFPIHAGRHRLMIGGALALSLTSSAFPTLGLSDTATFTEAAWVAVGVIGAIGLRRSLRLALKEREDNWHRSKESRQLAIQAGIDIHTRGRVFRESVRMSGQIAFILAGVGGMFFVDSPTWLGRITLFLLHYGQLSWLINSASDSEDAEEIGRLTS